MFAHRSPLKKASIGFGGGVVVVVVVVGLKRSMMNWNGFPPPLPALPWLTGEGAGAGTGAGAGAGTGKSTPTSRYPLGVVIISQEAFFTAAFDLLHSSYSGVPRSAAVILRPFIMVAVRNFCCAGSPTKASSSGKLLPRRVIAKTVMAKPTHKHGKRGSLRPIFQSVMQAAKQNSACFPPACARTENSLQETNVQTSLSHIYLDR